MKAEIQDQRSYTRPHPPRYARLLANDETSGMCIIIRIAQGRAQLRGGQRARRRCLPGNQSRHARLHSSYRGREHTRWVGTNLQAERRSLITRRRRARCTGICGIARATRSPPALSLLRRTHDHHRDHRALEATTRATSRSRTNREQQIVTRHGLGSPHGHAQSPTRSQVPM